MSLPLKDLRLGSAIASMTDQTQPPIASEATPANELAAPAESDSNTDADFLFALEFDLLQKMRGDYVPA